MSLFRSFLHPLRAWTPLRSLGILLGASAGAFADPSDFGSSFTASSGIAGQSMIQSVGDTTNSIVNLIMGPGMFVVMAIGALLALFGWGRGQKESLWTGLILFILGAVLRGIWSFI